MDRNSDEWMEYVSRELAAADKRISEHADEIKLLKQQIDGTQNLLTENARAVQQVAVSIAEMLDVFSSWKGAMRTLEMLGKMAKPVATIAGLLAALASIWVAWKTGGAR